MCYVHPRDLQPGDVVNQPLPKGSREYIIVRITGGTGSRSGIIRWLDDSAEQVKMWHITAHLLYVVTGGPKLAAARLHPELIDKLDNWTGGKAPEEVKTE